MHLFKNLNLLFFLPIVVLPILLHLITVYRLRTVELSTFRFLMSSYVQQRRRVRLLEWLLMLLRTAFVALIILALSRPELSGLRWLPGATASGDVALLIDAGPTMTIRSGGTASLERAKATATAIVRLLSSDSRVTVIRAAEQPEVLITRFAADPEAIVQAIEAIEPAAADVDLGAALEQVYPPGAADVPRRVYVITDARQSRWQRLTRHPVLQRIGPATHFAVIDVGPTEPVLNLAVLGRVPDQALRPIVGLPVMLDATVQNCSSEEPAETILSVMLDGRQVHRVNLALSPGQRVHRRLAVTPTRAGLIRGRLELPADAFAEDDTSLFCLAVAPNLVVLLVTPPPADDQSADSRLFLEAALTAPANAAAHDVGPQQLAAALDLHTVTADAISDEALNRSDVVVLADVPLDEATARRVRAFVDGGGGLLVLPGPSVQIAPYNDHLLVRPGGPALRLGEPVGDPDDEASFQVLGDVDLNHPTLNVFEPEAQRDQLSRIMLYRWFPLTLSSEDGGAAADVRILMRLADRTPVLAETRIGAGKVLLAGIPGSPNWSNLPLQGRFVPLVLRALAHLCRGAPAQVPAGVAPNHPAPIVLSEQWATAQVQVTDPAGTPHTIDMHRSGRLFVGAMRATGARGYYDVQITPRGDDAAQRTKLGFAVNLDHDLEDMAGLDEAGFRALFGDVELTFLKGVPEDPVLAERLTEKREIWRWLIGVMFAVIFVELFLATLRPGATPTTPEAEMGSARRVGRRISDVMDRAGIWVSVPRPDRTSPTGQRTSRGSH